MRITEQRDRTYLSRRDVIVLGIGTFVVAAVPLSRRARRTLFRRSLPLMGTIADITVLHRNPHDAHAAIDAAFEQLAWVERTMTAFSRSSDVGRANQMAAAGPVSITSATAEVLTEAVEWADVSEGAFDPCLGEAVALWDVANRREPPPADQVSRLAGRKLYRSLDIGVERGGCIVRLHDRDAKIDLGGIAKGYGVDRAVEALRNSGISQALVNVGGDLYAIGESDDGDPWKVGIRSPHDPTQLAGTLEVSDRAVATSGDYLQFFEHHGRRYHHLLDPATGAPRPSAGHSVTVTADRCMRADAAATLAFAVPSPRAEELLRARAPEARIVHRV